MRGLLCILAILAAAGAAAAPIPVADFAKAASVEDMKMSPDGKYLAVVVPQGDYETSLITLDAATLKPVGGLRSAQNKLVGDFWWVSNERLVIAVAEKFGGLDEPQLIGHLVGVNVDGKNPVRIYGAAGEIQAGTRIKTRADDTDFASMVDPLPDDPRHAVIAIWPLSQEVPYTELHRIDVKSGSRTKLARAPLRGADFLVNRKGEPRLAWGTTTEGWQQLYRRTEGDEWLLVNDEQQSGIEMIPLAPADKDGAYLWVRPASGGGRVVQWAPDEGEIKVLHEASTAEPDGILTSADRARVLAVVRNEERKSLDLIERDSVEGHSLALLSKSFPGQLVLPISWSSDAKQLLFQVSSDRNSGEYYLFDTATGKARFLLARDEWLDPEQMQARTPIQLNARDGLVLHGYLTAPAQTEKGAAPLVVVPHGGPHGIRDDWSFDVWSQLLASRGYAVLQVNFRGSGGYGQEFQSAGHRQWGGAMINDLIDATRWAVAQGHADEKRICIFGASYGGYAALMSAAREPDLFRCAISYAGLSDLQLMYDRGDIQQSSYGESYLKRVIGDDDAELTDYSPLTHVGRIKAAVMLAHGGDDRRVPQAHAERMREALEEQGQDVEWLAYPNEGHGYYQQAHRAEFYERLLAFLATHTAAQP